MVYTDKWKNPKVRTKIMMMMITIGKAIHLYKFINGHSPSYKKNSDVSDRNSQHRSLNLYWPCFKKKSSVEQSFSLRAAKLWNSLP